MMIGDLPSADTAAGDAENRIAEVVMNETLRLLDQRMSLRRYAPRPIESEHVDAIIRSALRAPTAMNMMLYTILQIDDRAKKDRLAGTCGHRFIADAPLVLLFLADMQRWVDYYEAFGIPALCEREGTPFRTPKASNLMMSCCDALIAAHASVVAAESLGIGSCYIGDIMGHCETHREMFDLPRWTFPITLVCYGYYPDDLARRRTTRFDARFVRQFDAYRRLTRADFEEMLAETQARLADHLEARDVGLAEATYRGFTIHDAELEEARSVDILLADWLGEG